MLATLAKCQVQQANLKKINSKNVVKLAVHNSEVRSQTCGLESGVKYTHTFRLSGCRGDVSVTFFIKKWSYFPGSWHPQTVGVHADFVLLLAANNKESAFTLHIFIVLTYIKTYKTNSRGTIMCPYWNPVKKHLLLLLP